MSGTTVLTMQDERLEETAARMRVLAHPVRLRILALLECEKLSVSQIQERLDLNQALVSQHLQAMTAHRVLRYEKDGRQHVYMIRDETVCGLLRCIEKGEARSVQ